MRLVRWSNLLFLAALIWLMEKWVAVPILDAAAFGEQLPGYMLLLLILATVGIAAGGYVINDYFDVKIDRINRPDELIVTNTVSKPAAMKLSLCLSYALEMVKWAPAVAYFSQQPPIAAVQMINEFSGGVITTHTKTTFLTDFEEQVKLALYVIEDGIVSPQIDDGDTIVDYVHNHVLRGSMNGTYGTFISDDGRVVADSGYVKSYRLVADGSWVPARCSVVAILMNATEPHEVLQVEKCPFLNE